jgi:mRNA-degrading endonuclease RelE of RelBE toxin-antitoxin system
MVDILPNLVFDKTIRKIKDISMQEHIKKQTKKIIENPETGKPMRYSMKGLREVYVGSFRLSYHYSKEDNTIMFIDFYHKDEQKFKKI